MINIAHDCSYRRQTGLSLIELMISITIGFILLLALSGLFINSSRNRNEMQKSANQQESGRYASQLLSDNLMLAGYLAEFDPTPLTTPAALPDPCATGIADLLTAMPLHVQGVTDTGATPSCVTDRKAGTDIIVERRVSTAPICGDVAAAACADFVAGMQYFQASLCSPPDGTELARSISGEADYAAHYFALSATAADFTRRKTNCVATNFAPLQRYLVHIYFIANNNEAGDGIPTLKRAELGGDAFTILPLVDGIENMQIEYGVDSDNNGVPNTYTSAPGTTADWRNVVTARIHLLARNTSATPGHTDSRSYTLGDKAVAATDDQFKRHVYSTSVQFINPSRRLQ